MIKKSKQHLTDANEGYLLHMLMALKISTGLFSASIKAFIHAFIPGLFLKSASSKIKELYLFVEKRKQNK